MKIYLIDVKLGDSQRRTWETMLPCLPIAVEWRHHDRRLIGRDDTTANIEKGVVLVHDRPTLLPLEWRTAIFTFAATKSLTVILVSGQPTRSDSTNHVYYRRTPVGGGCDTTFAKCFNRFWKDYVASGGIPKFSLLEPEGSEGLTLRLLCEAWQIVNDQGKGECNGIPIKAPNTKTEWLAPFETGATANGIAALMGEAKKVATDLFDAVERPQEKNLKAAVSSFLAAISTQ